MNMSEISWTKETSWKKVRVFHYNITPNCSYYEIESLVKMITRFLSFSSSNLFVILLFTDIIKELPSEFFHYYHCYPWYYTPNHCYVKIRILRPSIFRFLEIIHHPFSHFSIFFEDMKSGWNSQHAYNEKYQLWSMLFDYLKWTVFILTIVILRSIVLFVFWDAGFLNLALRFHPFLL